MSISKIWQLLPISSILSEKLRTEWEKTWFCENVKVFKIEKISNNFVLAPVWVIKRANYFIWCNISKSGVSKMNYYNHQKFFNFLYSYCKLITYLLVEAKTSLYFRRSSYSWTTNFVLSDSHLTSLRLSNSFSHPNCLIARNFSFSGLKLNAKTLSEPG